MSRGASAMSKTALHGTRFVTHQTVTVPAYIAEYQRHLDFVGRLAHDVCLALLTLQYKGDDHQATQ